MKERPILFSGPMIRALLTGTKTVTRRIVSPQPKHWSHYIQPMWGTSPPPEPVEFGDKWLWREAGPDYPDDDSDDRRCPYGVPGDQLWVRETHAQFAVGNRERNAPQCVAYRATCDEDGGFDYVNNGDEIMHLKVTKWTPSIFMPRWASRITLEITDVRAERLHDITEEQAQREGADKQFVIELADFVSGKKIDYDKISTYRNGFAALWREINGDASWKANPWVWVVEFKRIKPAVEPIADLIARSSIGAALADIKERGIDAHLVDLEAEMKPKRTRRKR